jgi:putative endonuclease
MLASKSRVLYVGVTGALMLRVLRHKAGRGGDFTRKYRVNRLVWNQSFESVGNAIERETEIKAWRRKKKVALIRENNPTWEDLAAGWGERVELKVRVAASKSRFLTTEAVRNDIQSFIWFHNNP